jgi:hypothetical protein
VVYLFSSCLYVTLVFILQGCSSGFVVYQDAVVAVVYIG